MRYKVFLVEDEIVTREGIRDNVNWDGLGFEFVGDAPDGEMALPSLQSFKPDVLITDIRMPFMDGLELSQIVRERMPATKIVILSGHDEFEYAQKAIKLGVCEYLLKPVSVQDLHNVLRKLAARLDAEKGEQEALRKLRDQLAETRTALRDRFLLNLVTGTTSSVGALEKSAELGIELLARCYLVAVMRLEATVAWEQLDFRKYEQAHAVIAGMLEGHPDVFLLRKDLDELVLLVKGASPELLYAERDTVLERAGQAVGPMGFALIGASGTPQYRVTDICHSFAQAAGSLHAEAGSPEHSQPALAGAPPEADQALGQSAGIVRQAQDYILAHYMDPELSLNGVAARVNLSASYFSAVFSQQAGRTFKEYLTEIRLNKAKELLRMTSMMAFEISNKVGYGDPHYFSYVFRKHTGLTPMEFRAQAGRRS